MSEEEIFEKIKEMIIEQFGIDNDVITKESSFIDDLQADSLDIVELVMEIEENFDIQIPDSYAESITTVQDVVNYIKEQQ